MYKKLFVLATAPLFFLGNYPLYAARPVDLSHQKAAILTSFMQTSKMARSANSPSLGASAPTDNIEEVNRSVDRNDTLHVRIQQKHAGYPVWGADGVVHVPQSGKNKRELMSMTATPNIDMNGIIYQALEADLANTPANVFNRAQAEKAVQKAIEDYRARTEEKCNVGGQQSGMIVFVDEHHKAHWAYQVNFTVQFADVETVPARPVYIIDAVTLEVYKHWNEIKTLEEKEDVFAGGFGGNEKMGKLVYDGLSDHLDKLKIKRNAATKTCYLQNTEITILKYDHSVHHKFFPDDEHDVGIDFTFPCETTNAEHGNIFWNETDMINGAYSPANDAMFQGMMVKNLYRQWYGQEVLVKNGKPENLKMIVHKPFANALWDPVDRQMTFGDGVVKNRPDVFHPFTSLGITAHEISHVFTERFSNLKYEGQSGGINEAFSDMAAKAAEFYAYGNDVNWAIGAEIFKGDGALRYMDWPSKDCGLDKRTGVNCSIDNVSEYLNDTGDKFHEPTDVHYSSGVFNRVFYLLATSVAEGWDTRKAFDVMVEANMHYWRKSSNFNEAACGVLKANNNIYHYNVDAINRAFKTVGIDTTQC